MTTPRDFTTNTGWGRADNKKYPREFFASPLNTHRRKSTLHRHSKRLKTSQASLFYLLHTDILMNIEIWVSDLKHLDKFKPVVSRINTMCNPILFTIPHYLWTTYQRFGIFRLYNEEHYEWVHRRFFSMYTGPWIRYKYFANT